MCRLILWICAQKKVVCHPDQYALDWTLTMVFVGNVWTFASSQSYDADFWTFWSSFQKKEPLIRPWANDNTISGKGEHLPYWQFPCLCGVGSSDSVSEGTYDGLTSFCYVHPHGPWGGVRPGGTGSTHPRTPVTKYGNPNLIINTQEFQDCEPVAPVEGTSTLHSMPGLSSQH